MSRVDDGSEAYIEWRDEMISKAFYAGIRNVSFFAIERFATQMQYEERQACLDIIRQYVGDIILLSELEQAITKRGDLPADLLE